MTAIYLMTILFAAAASAILVAPFGWIVAAVAAWVVGSFAAALLAVWRGRDALLIAPRRAAGIPSGVVWC